MALSAKLYSLTRFVHGLKVRPEKRLLLEQSTFIDQLALREIGQS